MKPQYFVITRQTGSKFAYMKCGKDYPKRKDLTQESALELSILKWKKIVEYSKAHPDVNVITDGLATCGLCIKYYHGGKCTHCPILKKTGKVLCEGSPHMDFCRSRTAANARAELKFLQSLVKKEVK